MERLALIEVFDFEGRYQHAVPVRHWPVTVGRALDCDVVLNDPHVAAHHLALAIVVGGDAPGHLQLTVGDTRNGVRLAGHGRARTLHAGAAVPVAPGSVCHLGRSSLRIRLAGDALADEEPLGTDMDGGRVALTLAACAALLLWLGFAQWLQSEPGASWDKYLPPLLGAGVGVLIWAALWGLASKIFQRHFGIMVHLRVLLAFLLASIAVDGLLQLVAYALGVPLLSHLRGWVDIAIVTALLATHVNVLLPGRERIVRLSFAVLCVAVLGIDGALTWRHHQRLFDEQFAAALPPPGLRLVGARPVGAVLSEVRTVRAALEKRAKDDEDDDTTAAED